MKQRGSLPLWVDANIASHWRQAPENKRGGQKKYRALAIESCLVVRKAYHLPLRQTEGFIKSIFGLLNVREPVPCYTTLCRRGIAVIISLLFLLTEQVNA
ncbi:transposase [Parafilimonas sp.]|uniref:transposase n=1 Tax=Parafilimonas sp. TaxID=1969739 RepID=UPI0039E32430